MSSYMHNVWTYSCFIVITLFAWPDASWTYFNSKLINFVEGNFVEGKTNFKPTFLSVHV